MNRIRILILLFATCIAGCSARGPEGALNTYNVRLARVLGQEVPRVQPRMVPRLPRQRELERNFPTGSINLLQFLEIRDCELGHLVAERNSVLGRVAVTSQRLVYDLNFLRTGNACLKLIGAAHPRLAALIKRDMSEKKQQLPAVIWQATLGGREFRKFWRFGGDPLPARLPPQENVLLAIRQLQQDAGKWLAGNYGVNSDNLEHQLEVIRHGDGGLQLRAWQTLSNELAVATRILAERETRRPLCYPGMHPPAAKIFGNVVREMLIQRIQPWEAQLNRRYYELFPAIRRLEATLAGGEPGPYREWRHQRDRALDFSIHSVLRHVNKMQPLLAQCSLMPQVR